MSRFCGDVNAYAIIMAGGNGERFWPLSTPELPKQFLDLFGGKPLISQAVDRLMGLIPVERIFVITADRFVGLTRDVLPMVPAENVIGEPCRRDTAAAVATACGLVLKNGGEDAVGCILTADTLISPRETFQRELADAIRVAEMTDAIVTMGIRPTRPETGFGYIECGDDFASSEELTASFAEVLRFVEKPDYDTAKKYMDSGRFLWNAGMFIWKASVMREAFSRHARDIAPLIEAISGSECAKRTLDVLYPQLRSISVDFAVMEHAERIIVAKTTFVWDDVGSWTAVENHFPADADGNVVLGNCLLQNCRGVAAVNRMAGSHVLAVSGLRDAVVVQTRSATLVCSKEESKNLKTLVRRLT